MSTSINKIEDAMGLIVNSPDQGSVIRHLQNECRDDKCYNAASTIFKYLYGENTDECNLPQVLA